MIDYEAYVRGTGSAINVSCGFIPSLVVVFNLTDEDKIHFGHPFARQLPFTSGGTTEILMGHELKGATSGATARVLGVLTDTGTWAAGTAAGWIFIDEMSKVGTFASENVYINDDTASGTNDATVTVDITYTQDLDDAVASATTDNMVTAYLGSAGSAAVGFTLGSTISEDAKLLKCLAFRPGPGGSPTVVNTID